MNLRRTPGKNLSTVHDRKHRANLLPVGLLLMTLGAAGFGILAYLSTNPAPGLGVEFFRRSGEISGVLLGAGTGITAVALIMRLFRR